jgi:hypothetical protein
MDVTAVLLVATACTSGGDGVEPATGPDAASFRGGTLRVAQVVSERAVRYSFDQFTSLPALDRIALVPGSES